MDVKKIAHLARLTITPEEEKTFQLQLTSILNYFKDLEKVNTDNIEPLVTPTDIAFRGREDQVEVWKGSEVALANAPEKSGHLFKVPPVV